MEKTKKVKYISNQKFYEALKNYQEKKEINPQEKVPNYIGECFMKIANNIARKPSFSGYPFKDEMIGDAIEMMIRYMHNFDVTKENQNPFAYFSQYAFNAFLQRIAREKKALKTKNDYISERLVTFDDICKSEINTSNLSGDLLTYLQQFADNQNNRNEYYNENTAEEFYGE